jgi:hypothetical protein
VPREIMGGDRQEGVGSDCMWNCRACGTRIRTRPSDTGRQFVCPKCSARQSVPRLGGAVEPQSVNPSVPGESLRAMQRNASASVALRRPPSSEPRHWWIVAAAILGVAAGVALLLPRVSSKLEQSFDRGTAANRSQRVAETPSEPWRLAAGYPAVRTVELAPPQDAGELQRGLAVLELQRSSLGNDPQSERQRALLRLRMYRLLCGLPEMDLVLDVGMNEDAVAAAEACRRLGTLTHRPENPGMPAEAFARAQRGAGKGNLAMGYENPSMAVDGWMDDSDATNIRTLGHRRWCLNPPLRRVGFGQSQRWLAMWAHDTSGTSPFLHPAICYPPAGIVPVGMFRSQYAWSVTVNPRQFAKPRPGMIGVEVRPVVESGAVGEALNLELVTIETSGYGVDNCIIFKPAEISTSEGTRYRVVIAGLEDHDGRGVALRYVTAFVR